MTDRACAKPCRPELGLCRECLRLELDRRPSGFPGPCGTCDVSFDNCVSPGGRCCDDCNHRGGARSWLQWFDGDKYLGERSARAGPDDVNATQRCDCEVCRGTVRP